MKQDRSKALMEKAKALIPGGVNSPVRAYGAVGGTPPFIKSASGASLTDEDGNRYLDFVLSWGPMILGHRHPQVLSALQDALAGGTSFGAPTEREVRMAETVTRLMPNVEMVRMVNSGTEATMSAIRLARGATGRAGIIKVAGCHHGHGDSMLVAAGSGATTFGMPSSPGVPAGIAEPTFVIPYNDTDALQGLLTENAD